MESPIEGRPVPTGTPSPRAARPARPKHTIATILLMALVSSAVLYGVRWSVREESSSIHVWDFRTLPYGESPWTFPSPRLEQDNEGVTYLAIETGPGPILAMGLETGTVRSVRATIEITRESDGEPVPYALEWYWASAEDIEAAGESWPFSGERGTYFQLLDRHTPNIHTARLSRHHKWKGQIARAFIGVKIPPHEVGPFEIRTKRIEFLE